MLYGERDYQNDPDQLGYKDRGKMKWQGLILSAQTEMHKQALKDKKSKYPNAKK